MKKKGGGNKLKSKDLSNHLSILFILLYNMSKNKLNIFLVFFLNTKLINLTHFVPHKSLDMFFIQNIYILFLKIIVKI